MTLVNVPCTVIRAGANRGVFFHERDVPVMSEDRKQFLLGAMGSPDPNQLNGLGGGSLMSSQVGIVAPSSRPDVDVTCTFAVVGIDKPIVTYEGNFGDLFAAAGQFAIDEGLVDAEPPITRVRIYNTNTDRYVLTQIPSRGYTSAPVQAGSSTVASDFGAAGPGETGAGIEVTFLNPGGSVTGQLLPTGHVSDELHIDGLGRLTVTVVDVGSPFIFVAASDLGLSDTELLDDLLNRPDTVDVLDTVRRVVSGAVELPAQKSRSTVDDSLLDMLRVVIVAEPQPHKGADGHNLHIGQMDVLARTLASPRLGYAYTVAGTVCTAAARTIPGTVVSDLAGRSLGPGDHHVTIAHPAGLTDVGVQVSQHAVDVTITSVTLRCPTRRIMDGEVAVDLNSAH